MGGWEEDEVGYRESPDVPEQMRALEDPPGKKFSRRKLSWSTKGVRKLGEPIAFEGFIS